MGKLYLRFTSCPRCIRPTRWPKDGSMPLCRFCKHEGTNCARCGKPLTTDARKSPVGYVCRHCARYYEEKKKCPVCKKMVLSLSRNLKAKGTKKPVCDTCRERKTLKGYRNCGYCGKCRAVAKTDPNGLPVCKECVENGGTPIICRKCGAIHPHYIRGFCRECYLADLAERRRGPIRDEIRQEWVRDLFDRFAADEISRMKSNTNLLRTLNGYGDFFKKIDVSVPDPPTLTQRRLFELFGPHGMMTYVVPYRFLIRNGTIPEDEKERLAIINELHRKRTLAKAAGKWYEKDLLRYIEFMETLHRRYAEAGYSRYLPRTINIHLEYAVRILGSPALRSVRDLRQIDAERVKEFLRTTKTTYDSVRGFIIYLNQVVKLFRTFTLNQVYDEIRKEIKESDKGREKWKGVRLKPARFTGTRVTHASLLYPKTYMRLIRKFLRKEGGENPKEAAICLFMLLYAQKPKDIMRLRREDCFVDDDGDLCLRFGTEPLPLEERVAKVVRRYLEQREVFLAKRRDPDNPHLFPGVMPGSTISITNMKTYLKKHGISATKATASALFYAFRDGDARARIVVDAYGVDRVTAIRYRNEANPDIKKEIAERAER